MISIIITAFKEPRTISRAISAVEQGFDKKHETIVIAPDDETLNEAKKLVKKYPSLVFIKDKGNGKPAALNLAVSKAKGDILVLTDGDVYVGENAVNNLIEVLEDKKIGAVSGRPVSIDEHKNKYGYWGYVLSETAHIRRVRALNSEKRFFCSGYLFAIRKALFPKLSEKLLSEDGYISLEVYRAGFTIGYAPNSKVFIKYPTNFSDWIKQKRRSAGGYSQIKNMTGVNMRSFSKESSGIFDVLRYVRSLKEFIWLINLVFARVYLWAVIFRDVEIKKKGQKELWQRVDSTK